MKIPTLIPLLRTTPVTDSNKNNHLGMMLSINKGKHSAQMTLNTVRCIKIDADVSVALKYSLQPASQVVADLCFDF